MPSWFTVVCAMFPLLWILLNNNFGLTGAVSHSRNSLSSANNHKINPKPCSVNGLEGICMFVWECINTDGKHIGMCVDTFMFGSCCAHNLTASQITQIADASEPAILYTQHNTNSNNLKPSAANRPSRPRPKPSPTTVRPALYLPNHNDADRVSSSNARPVHNQIRPNHHSNNLYNSIDKSDATSWSSSQSPSSQHQHHQQQHHYAPSSQPPHPTPSQHFHNSLPDRINAPSHSKPHSHQIASQTSTKSPATTASSPSYQVWTIAPNVAANYAAVHTASVHSAAAANSRPNFVSRPTILSTVLPAAHSQNSSHFVALTSSSSGNSTHADGAAPNDNSNNQNNWESNEIEDISNAIDSNGIYPFRPHHWHTSTSAPFMSWTKSSSKAPPQFVTKPKPWSYTNKYSYTYSTAATTAYGGGVSTSTTGVTVSSTSTTTTTSAPSTSTTSTSPATFAASSNKFPIYKPFSSVNTNLPSSTITSVASSSASFTPRPQGTMTHLVSASTADKGTQCGISPMQPPRHEIRIVGGRNAQFGVWAWQVSVRRTSFFGFSSTHRCGGALLNENWIATAGHCVDDLLTSQIKIRVGEYDFSSIQEPYPFAERGVARKVVHPKYNFFTYEYDLAMVRLDSPLEYAPHIVPICLPGSDDLLIGENATVTGWGRLSEGGTLPSVLQEVSVPIVSNDKCKNMFLRAGRQEHIPDIFMCAGFDNGGRDSCQGDSGGPLQVKGKDGRYFLAGIISWGIGCAEANLPGVCTRISKFVPWILQTVT